MAALTHEFTEALSAPRERVFQALTDENELTCWFAEAVEVEPRAGGEYRFWGLHTPGVPTRAQAAQKVIRIQAPRLLAFSWMLEGRDSEVTLELEAADEGASTVLKGRHHFQDAPDVPRPLDLVDDLWRISLANLRAHLTGGQGVCMPDFSDPVTRIRQTIAISASREQIYEALLNAEFLEKWLGGKSVVESRVGGRYSYGWQYEVRGKPVQGGPTKILEMVEDTKLVTDWPNWRGDPEMPAQRITWLLEPVGDHTRVILIHEPFERTTDLSDYPQGWAYFLSRLKEEIEGAQPA
jgi:uncharacterized protein YndB with AHSA1/START domain